MLLHLPVFLNWLTHNAERHVPLGQECRIAGQAGRCKLCRFIDVMLGYWVPSRDPNGVIQQFWTRVFQDWNGGANGGQQDAVEFWAELFRQFKVETRSLL